VRFANVTALGVVGRYRLSRLLPQRVLLWISAVSFVLIGTLMAAGLL
jgi:putative Ca2+/H+ antiporter (TMEM165/GDT1 family)